MMFPGNWVGQFAPAILQRKKLPVVGSKMGAAPLKSPFSCLGSGNRDRIVNDRSSLNLSYVPKKELLFCSIAHHKDKLNSFCLSGVVSVPSKTFRSSRMLFLRKSYSDA